MCEILCLICRIYFPYVGIESVVEKPSFKKLILRGKRCIVLFSGFYEWKLENKLKQPYFVYLKDDSIKSESDENHDLKEKNNNDNNNNNNNNNNNDNDNENENGNENENIIMAIAGLYDEWEDSTGNTIRTYTTLTCPACTGFQWLHTRQPVFLTEKLADAWLDPKVGKNYIIFYSYFLFIFINLFRLFLPFVFPFYFHILSSVFCVVFCNIFLFHFVILIIFSPTKNFCILCCFLQYFSVSLCYFNYF